MMRLHLALCGTAFAPCALAGEAPVPGVYSGMLQSFLALALVVGAIAAVAWILKRVARPATGASQLLKVVGTHSLGPRERLVVVEVGESWLVLGVTGQSINSLHTMARQESSAATSPKQPGFDFSRILSRAFGRETKI